MFSAFLAALIEPIQLIGTKKIFGKKKINYKSFLVLNMFFIFFFSSIAYIFWGDFNLERISIFIFYLFAIEIFLSFMFNILFYYALSGEKVSRVQPIAMLVPVFSIAMATLVFPDERNWPVVAIAVFAAFVLAISRIERHHLVINKYSLAMLGFVLVISIQALFAKALLEVFSPVAFYTIRVGILTFLFALFLRPNLKVFGKKRTSAVFWLSLLITAQMLSWFFAIEQIGIVQSSLIFLLGPVLTLVASRFYLKEKISKKAIIANTVIVICVVASILVSS